jgi:hypothetical protein
VIKRTVARGNNSNEKRLIFPTLAPTSTATASHATQPGHYPLTLGASPSTISLSSSSHQANSRATGVVVPSLPIHLAQQAPPIQHYHYRHSTNASAASHQSHSARTAHHHQHEMEHSSSTASLSARRVSDGSVVDGGNEATATASVTVGAWPAPPTAIAVPVTAAERHRGRRVNLFINRGTHRVWSWPMKPANGLDSPHRHGHHATGATIDFNHRDPFGRNGHEYKEPSPTRSPRGARGGGGAIRVPAPPSESKTRSPRENTKKNNNGHNGGPSPRAFPPSPSASSLTSSTTRSPISQSRRDKAQILAYLNWASPLPPHHLFGAPPESPKAATTTLSPSSHTDGSPVSSPSNTTIISPSSIKLSTPRRRHGGNGSGGKDNGNTASADGDRLLLGSYRGMHALRVPNLVAVPHDVDLLYDAGGVRTLNHLLSFDSQHRSFATMNDLLEALARACAQETMEASIKAVTPSERTSLSDFLASSHGSILFGASGYPGASQLQLSQMVVAGRTLPSTLQHIGRLCALHQKYNTIDEVIQAVAEADTQQRQAMDAHRSIANYLRSPKSQLLTGAPSTMSVITDNDAARLFDLSAARFNTLPRLKQLNQQRRHFHDWPSLIRALSTFHIGEGERLAASTEPMTIIDDATEMLRFFASPSCQLLTIGVVLTREEASLLLMESGGSLCAALDYCRIIQHHGSIQHQASSFRSASALILAIASAHIQAKKDLIAYLTGSSCHIFNGIRPLLSMRDIDRLLRRSRQSGCSIHDELVAQDRQGRRYHDWDAVLKTFESPYQPNGDTEMLSLLSWLADNTICRLFVPLVGVAATAADKSGRNGLAITEPPSVIDVDGIVAAAGGDPSTALFYLQSINDSLLQANRVGPLLSTTTTGAVPPYNSVRDQRLINAVAERQQRQSVAHLIAAPEHALLTDPTSSVPPLISSADIDRLMAAGAVFVPPTSPLSSSTVSSVPSSPSQVTSISTTPQIVHELIAANCHFTSMDELITAVHIAAASSIPAPISPAQVPTIIDDNGQSSSPMPVSPLVVNVPSTPVLSSKAPKSPNKGSKAVSPARSSARTPIKPPASPVKAPTTPASVPATLAPLSVAVAAVVPKSPEPVPFGFVDWHAPPGHAAHGRLNRATYIPEAMSRSPIDIVTHTKVHATKSRFPLVEVPFHAFFDDHEHHANATGASLEQVKAVWPQPKVVNDPTEVVLVPTQAATINNKSAMSTGDTKRNGPSSIPASPKASNTATTTSNESGKPSPRTPAGRNKNLVIDASGRRGTGSNSSPNSPRSPASGHPKTPTRTGQATTPNNVARQSGKVPKPPSSNGRSSSTTATPTTPSAGGRTSAVASKAATPAADSGVGTTITPLLSPSSLTSTIVTNSSTTIIASSSSISQKTIVTSSVIMSQ